MRDPSPRSHRVAVMDEQKPILSALPVMPTGSAPGELNWKDWLWAIAHKAGVLFVAVLWGCWDLATQGAVAAADEIKTNGVQLIRLIPGKGWWLAGLATAICVLILQARRDNRKPEDKKPEEPKS